MLVVRASIEDSFFTILLTPTRHTVHEPNATVRCYTGWSLHRHAPHIILLLSVVGFRHSLLKGIHDSVHTYVRAPCLQQFLKLRVKCTIIHCPWTCRPLCTH